VDVEHRRIVERDADCGQLGGKCRGKLPGECGIVAPAQHSHRRPLGERRAQPRNAPALLIDANPRRHLYAQASDVERELGDLFGTFNVGKASKEGNSPQIELASERSQLNRNGRAGEATDEELPDAAAKRLRRHDWSL
jgi:hypothetical protein